MTDSQLIFGIMQNDERAWRHTPLKGDIIVFPAVGKHIWGHIQMWNGNQWISDFKQKNMIPAKAYYNTNWKIYRHNSYFYTGLEP